MITNFSCYDAKKIKPIYYDFNKNNEFHIMFLDITPLMDIIIPSGHIIIKKCILKHLNQFKKPIRKLSSNFCFYGSKKIRSIYYIFNQKMHFLYILLKMKTLKGIILPKTYLMFKNDMLQDVFIFKNEVIR